MRLVQTHREVLILRDMNPQEFLEHEGLDVEPSLKRSSNFCVDRLIISVMGDQDVVDKTQDQKRGSGRLLDVQVLIKARLLETETEEKASQRLGPQPAATSEAVESTVELECRSGRDIDTGGGRIYTGTSCRASRKADLMSKWCILSLW